MSDIILQAVGENCGLTLSKLHWHPSTAFACFASTHEFFGSVALVEIEVLGIWAFEKAQVGTHVGN